MTPGVRALGALWVRETVRFVRQPSRMVAATGTPVLFWAFAGAGFSGSFDAPGFGAGGGVGGYAAYLLPGMTTLVILLTSVFAAISLIQDRDEGFLRSALASPAPGWALAGSKAAAGSAIASAQACVLIAGAPLVGYELTVGGVAASLLAVVLTAVGVVSFGLVLAWRTSSAAGFHGVMNLVLMPMWLLSGALFPAEGASAWLAWVVRLNPLSWATACIGEGVGAGDAGAWRWAGTACLSALLFVVACARVARGRGARAGE